MQTPDDLDVFLAKRNAAFETMDLAWMHSMFPAADDETLEIAMHKARYDCITARPEQRHASAHWLRERGLNGTFAPLLPEGELPE